MVKKLSQIGLAAAVIMAGALGCNKASAPVVPANAAVLHLTIPSRIQSLLFKNAPATLTAQNAVPISGQGALEYNLITDGAAPVTGVLFFDDVSQIGNIFINLPKAGTWVVAAELFSLSNPSTSVRRPTAQLVVPGLNASPEFVGADKVDVQGTTPFTLEMEDIGTGTESSCYGGTLTDPTNCDYLLNGVWVDLYSFDSNVEAASNTSTASTSDIQGLFDVTTQSTYLGSASGSTYAYLGNGDLVNYPSVPSGTTFYPDSLQAKGAVLGAASAAITINDVFVIKIPSQNAMVWFQPWIDSNDCSVGPGSSLMQFWFVYNNQNLNYMKFDETTYGRANCNQNPLPTPTFAP